LIIYRVPLLAHRQLILISSRPGNHALDRLMLRLTHESLPFPFQEIGGQRVLVLCVGISSKLIYSFRFIGSWSGHMRVSFFYALMGALTEKDLFFATFDVVSKGCYVVEAWICPAFVGDLCFVVDFGVDFM
jgi:hypothetical protein